MYHISMLDFRGVIAVHLDNLGPSFHPMDSNFRKGDRLGKHTPNRRAKSTFLVFPYRKVSVLKDKLTLPSRIAF